MSETQLNTVERDVRQVQICADQEAVHKYTVKVFEDLHTECERLSCESDTVYLNGTHLMCRDTATYGGRKMDVHIRQIITDEGYVQIRICTGENIDPEDT